jgi:DNA-binding NarL/FixJ family response regulator
MFDEQHSGDDGDRAGMTATASLSQPMRVWLVDDDKVFRSLCAKLLMTYPGVICDSEFGWAEELIDTLQQGPGPDAVLLDFGLPGMSGADAVPIIKSLSAGTAVLMYSTFRRIDAEARARAGGACGCLVKHEPFESVIAALEEAVRKLATTGRQPRLK